MKEIRPAGLSRFVLWSPLVSGNFGDGTKTYVADPVAFRMDAGIDAVATIQAAITKEGTISSKAFAAAVANGGYVEFNATLHFNQGNAFLEIGNPAARNIGRFSGIVEGTMFASEALGFYVVIEDMQLEDNAFSWVPDVKPKGQKPNRVANGAIRAVGSTTRLASPGAVSAAGLSINNYPGTPVVTHSGLVKVSRGLGKPVPMDFSRSYPFVAWGTR